MSERRVSLLCIGELHISTCIMSWEGELPLGTSSGVSKYTQIKLALIPTFSLSFFIRETSGVYHAEGAHSSSAKKQLEVHQV